MGNYTIKYLHANNLAGIIKHIPGHGSARTDSHKKMPIVSLSLKNLKHIKKIKCVLGNLIIFVFTIIELPITD